MAGARDVDRGYAWVVLAAVFGVEVLAIATMRTYGILYSEMLERFGTGAGETAWILSLSFFLLFAMSPVSTALGQRFSYRAVIIAGGFFSSAGFLTSAFAVPRMQLLYFTHGILVGIGSGLVFVPALVVTQLYFNKRRALAMALAMAGMGIGSVIWSYAFKKLLQEFGIFGTLLITAAINLHTCVFGRLMRPKISDAVDVAGVDVDIDVESELSIEAEHLMQRQSDANMLHSHNDQNGTPENDVLIADNQNYDENEQNREQIIDHSDNNIAETGHLLTNKANNVDRSSDTHAVDNRSDIAIIHTDNASIHTNTADIQTDTADNRILCADNQTVSIDIRKNDADNRKHRFSNILCSKDSIWCKILPDTRCCRRKTFWIYQVIFSFSLVGYFPHFATVPAYIEDIDFLMKQVVIVMSMLGLFDLLGRIVIAWISDMRWIGPEYLFAISSFLGGLLDLMMPFMHAFTPILVYVCLWAFFAGMPILLLPVIVRHKFGDAQLSQTLGMTYFLLSFMNLVGVPFQGWLKDLTGTWTLSFCVAGALLIFAGAIMLMDSLMRRPFCDRCRQCVMRKPGNTRKTRTERTTDGDESNDEDNDNDGHDSGDDGGGNGDNDNEYNVDKVWTGET